MPFSASTFSAVQVSTASSGNFRLYQGLKEFSLPAAITASPDGSIWFLVEGHEVMRFSPATSLFTAFTLPYIWDDPAPEDITVDPNGNAWFTFSNKLGRLTPDGVFTEFALPMWDSRLEGITISANGDVWFTAPNLVGRIGRLTPADGTITDYPLPVGSWASELAAGPDGKLWFTEGISYTLGNKVGCLTPSGQVREFRLPEISGTIRIAAGPDGNVWFTEWDAPTRPDLFSRHDRIARITPDGIIKDFVIPSAHSQPWGITAGADGNLWFSQLDGTIGCITPSGVFSEFRIPTQHGLSMDITAGRDGNIWFTDTASGYLGEFIIANSSSQLDSKESSVPGGLSTQISAAIDTRRTSPSPDSSNNASGERPLTREKLADSTAAFVLSRQQRSLEAGQADQGSIIGSLNDHWQEQASPPATAKAPIRAPGPLTEVQSSSKLRAASAPAQGHGPKLENPLAQFQTSFKDSGKSQSDLAFVAVDKGFQ